MIIFELSCDSCRTVLGRFKSLTELDESGLLQRWRIGPHILELCMQCYLKRKAEMPNARSSVR